MLQKNSKSRPPLFAPWFSRANSKHFRSAAEANGALTHKNSKILSNTYMKNSVSALSRQINNATSNISNLRHRRLHIVEAHRRRSHQQDRLKRYDSDPLHNGSTPKFVTSMHRYVEVILADPVDCALGKDVPVSPQHLQGFSATTKRTIN